MPPNGIDMAFLRNSWVCLRRVPVSSCDPVVAAFAEAAQARKGESDEPAHEEDAEHGAFAHALDALAFADAAELAFDFNGADDHDAVMVSGALALSATSSLSGVLKVRELEVVCFEEFGDSVGVVGGRARAA